MLLLPKIVPRELITQQSDELQPKPHVGVIILIAIALGMPTVSWAMQLNAALNQPNNHVRLENYTETGEMF